MMNTMFACVLNKKVSREEELKVTKAVFRDELTNSKMKSPPPCNAVKKKSVRFADSEPSVFGDPQDDEKSNNNRNELGGRGGIRVKLKMTKEEAARLISKCKQGGVLEFKDVARELVALPINRVSVVSSLHE